MLLTRVRRHGRCLLRVETWELLVRRERRDWWVSPARREFRVLRERWARPGLLEPPAHRGWCGRGRTVRPTDTLRAMW